MPKGARVQFDQAQTLLNSFGVVSGFIQRLCTLLHHDSALMTVVALLWRNSRFVNTYSCCFWCKHWLINRLGK